MSISDRVKGRTSEDVSPEDVTKLLEKIEAGGAESFKPAGLLLEAAEQYPDLIAKHHDHLASVLNTVLPPLVRRQLYDVVLKTEITSPESLKKIIDSAEADLIEGDATTREHIYQIIELAANEGVDVNKSDLEAFIQGIAASPADTPADSAMDAYLASVTNRDPVGNEELAPLIDFIESDFPEIRSAASEALVNIVIETTIEPDTNTDGIRMVLEDHESNSLPADRVTTAVEKLS